MRFFTRKAGQQVVLELNGQIIAVIEASEHAHGTGLRIGVAASPTLRVVEAETVESSRLKGTRCHWRDQYRQQSRAK